MANSIKIVYCFIGLLHVVVLNKKHNSNKETTIPHPTIISGLTAQYKIQSVILNGDGNGLAHQHTYFTFTALQSIRSLRPIILCTIYSNSSIHDCSLVTKINNLQKYNKMLISGRDKIEN